MIAHAGSCVCSSNHELTYNFIPAIPVNFVSSSYSVSEGGTVEVCLILETGQLERSVELSLVSQSDTAQQDVDYVALVLSVTQEPGVGQSCFSVEVVDDRIVEGEETFQILLTSHDPAVIVPTPGTALISIQDNDHDSKLQIIFHEVLGSLFILSLLYYNKVMHKFLIVPIIYMCLNTTQPKPLSV